MAVYNLGSINADLVYRVPHLPAPGETLAATAHSQGLGGKGANMSVALARAGSEIHHVGAVGADGIWMRDRLADYGVGAQDIAQVDAVSGHAVIAVDDAGENAILLFPGANNEISNESVSKALSRAKPSDIFLFQNETNALADSAMLAKEKGMRVAHAAAPFDAQAVKELLPLIDILFLNEVEAAQLTDATDLAPQDLPIGDVIVTLGAKGARWFDTRSGTQTDISAVSVVPVDTTGAGDTFTGYVIAGLDQGMSMPDALALASKAGALMVTRHGTADVIPTLEEVKAFTP